MLKIYNITKYLLIIVQSLLLYNTPLCMASCPIEEDPSNIARCIQVDVTAIIYAVRGGQDLTSFCQLADRYMECFKTYTRGCVGFHFAEGSLTELQNIALYCCHGIYSNPDCPLNMSVRKCIDEDAHATLSNGSKKKLKDLQIGDTVKTLDSNGQLVDTDVIMIIDKGAQNSTFLNIETYSGKSVRVSTTHLMPVNYGKYKHAKKLLKNDTILTYDDKTNKQVEEKIKSILIEPVEGYVAPLTMSGTILVNDILASCYAVVESHTLGHTVMAPVRLLYSLNHKIGRIMPGNFSIMTSSKQTENNGVHWYPRMLFSFTKNFLGSFVKLD